MYYRLLIALPLLIFVIGCSPELSAEAKKLKAESPDEYSKIVAMSDADLTAAISELSVRLREKRSTLPKSVAGASVGPTTLEQPDKPENPPAKAPDDGVSVQSLALPLEVMQQS